MHISQEVNTVAYALLVNMACVNDNDMVVYESCSPQASSCFQAYFIRVSTPL
jgi:hypothetical protein